MSFFLLPLLSYSSLPLRPACSPSLPLRLAAAASASSSSHLSVQASFLPSQATAFPSSYSDLSVPIMDVPSASTSTAEGLRDVAAMPDSPPRRSARHRRAQSEILLGAALPDDLAFDADLGVVGDAGGDDEDEENECEDEEYGGNGGGRSRMFEMFLEAGGRLAEPLEPAPYPPPLPARPRHQHSMSMDGSASLASASSSMGGRACAGADAKKAISDAKLAELSLVDPKRAKRILANRQSAARSKERKMRYIAELERKVQTLQTEASTLSAQLSMLQRDTTGLTSENSDLKLRVQTMEQQVRLQDALNDRLRDEVQQLKIATGQVNTDGGKMGKFSLPSYGINSQSYQLSHVQSLLAAQQLQQLQIHHSQQQQHQMQLQQQHLHQEMLPGDLKKKGIATTSHVQNAGSSAIHAFRGEP